MEKKLIWKNLLSDSCPKCGCKLVDDPARITCENADRFDKFQCDFFITPERLAELKHNMRDRFAERSFSHSEAENQEALNNL